MVLIFSNTSFFCYVAHISLLEVYRLLCNLELFLFIR